MPSGDNSDSIAPASPTAMTRCGRAGLRVAAATAATTRPTPSGATANRRDDRPSTMTATPNDPTRPTFSGATTDPSPALPSPPGLGVWPHRSAGISRVQAGHADGLNALQSSLLADP